MGTPTTEQLRDRIDKGETGEKIAMPDPATAPLGTDAEAGGQPPTGPELRLAEASSPKQPERVHRVKGGSIYLGLVAMLGAGVVIIVLVALGATGS
ncbi:hypothetical protein [uncultured Devosia sp.]|uniref:hypothetical protein n=1 Tax=uncultured Devosia sp. TaxID=211434 RepID=UPI0035CB1E95